MMTYIPPRIPPLSIQRSNSKAKKETSVSMNVIALQKLNKKDLTISSLSKPGYDEPFIASVRVHSRGWNGQLHINRQPRCCNNNKATDMTTSYEKIRPSTSPLTMSGGDATFLFESSSIPQHLRSNNPMRQFPVALPVLSQREEALRQARTYVPDAYTEENAPKVRRHLHHSHMMNCARDYNTYPDTTSPADIVAQQVRPALKGQWVDRYRKKRIQHQYSRHPMLPERALLREYNLVA